MKRVLDFYDEIVKCVCSIERRVDKRADVVRWSEILKDFDLEFAVYVPRGGICRKRKMKTLYGVLRCIR